MMKSYQRFLAAYGNWLALLLLLIFFGRLLATAQIKSATYDEILHVFQAALYWQNKTLYSVVQNPPLVNSVMGVPLALTFRPNLPESIEPISNWLAMSKSFMWEDNDTGLQMLAVARLAVMWMATLLAALVTRWSGQLFSTKTAGLLALVLFSFDPNILAHAFLATTDLGTTFFFALCGYLVWRYWRTPAPRSPGLYIAVGTVLGLTLAAKFSGLILIPAVIIIAGYRLLTGHSRRDEWWRTALEIGGWLVIGAFIFLLAYRFNWQTLALDFTWQRDHQLQGRLGFLLGEFGNGWWYYFPYIYAIKTPIPVMLLVFLSVGVFIWRRSWGWQVLWPLLLAAGVFAASMVSRVNIGYRYLLPMIPPLAVFVGQLAQPGYLKRGAAKVVVSLAVLLAMVISIATHPHYLAYFNVLVGGPEEAWQIVVDSNIDWGQDLKGLAGYMEENGYDFVNANWLGTAPLEAYGINGRIVEGWPAAKEFPLYDWFYPPRPAPGFYAFSATQLQGLYLKGDRERFNWFKERQPLDKIGYSLFVYDVPADGPRVGLALSGIGISTIEEDDFNQAFQSNDVQPRWFDARSSLVWPGGSADGVTTAAWAAVGDGHLPENAALQALYPQGGPLLHGIGKEGMQYSLFRWSESPLSMLLAGEQGDAVKVDLGWTPKPDVGSDSWDKERIPLDETAVLGEVLELEGYQPLWPDTLRAGEPLQMLSFWKVIDPPQEEIKLFLHLLDGNGEIVAQHDGLDILAQGLQPGDELIQLHAVQLPGDLAPGEYALQIGAYRSGDFSRLMLADDRSDRVLLEKVAVVTPVP
ncbi:MAG: ArnT family glycosyltransferase [Candidatus Promineifilaceae bacterium]